MEDIDRLVRFRQLGDTSHSDITRQFAIRRQLDLLHQPMSMEPLQLHFELLLSQPVALLIGRGVMVMSLVTAIVMSLVMAIVVFVVVRIMVLAMVVIVVMLVVFAMSIVVFALVMFTFTIRVLALAFGVLPFAVLVFTFFVFMFPFAVLPFAVFVVPFVVFSFTMFAVFRSLAFLLQAAMVLRFGIGAASLAFAFTLPLVGPIVIGSAGGVEPGAGEREAERQGQGERAHGGQAGNHGRKAPSWERLGSVGNCSMLPLSTRYAPDRRPRPGQPTPGERPGCVQRAVAATLLYNESPSDLPPERPRMRPSSPFRPAFIPIVTVFCLAVCCGGRGEAAEPISFNRDIRPILAENCFQCHGPDEDSREADLRLDVRAGATADRDGAQAVAPGDPAASAILERIRETDEALRMPPPETEKSLTEEQVRLLEKWIEQGAKYERHWAFNSIERPSVPAVARSAAIVNPIDAFVQQRLDTLDLPPSVEAERATLIRRLYLDLLGVLPSPDDVERFEADQSPDAYTRLVDRVLADPRFGERWGRHWLDQARYADSHGYTNDNARVMWPYRDWVIAALNRDLPFDQFTIEQLAGDLLPNPTTEQLIATGFHRNTLINTEGGTKADQFRDEQVKDRVDTTGSVWLGLTVGCAKCHTHKYDPLLQREYYSLYAFFNSTQDNNSIAPTLKAPTREQARRLAELTKRLEGLEAKLADDPERAKRQQAWEANLLEAEAEDSSDGDSDNWTLLTLSGKSKDGAVLKSLDDQSVLATGANVAADEYLLTARSPVTKIRSVRIEALTDPSLPKTGPGRASNGNFVLSEFFFRTGDGRLLRFNKAFADHSQPDFQVSKAIDLKTETGWAINGSPEGGANHNRVAWFVLPTPLEVDLEHALTFTMQFHNGNSAYNLGRFRLSVSAEPYVDKPSTGALLKLAGIPAEKRTAEQQQKLDAAFLQQDPKLASTHAGLQQTTKQLEQVRGEIASTMILRELAKPRTAHVQIRGDFLRTTEVAPPETPAALPPMPAADSGEPTQRNRLDFAKWLFQPDHPLTARVRVNRLWMRLFGVGLVETENDFGIQGTLPSHPQLLDWLAAELMELDWSTKQMLRTIVMSHTYRQSSRHRADLNAKDPKNRLLGRQNRIRVEAEIVRDVALSASGMLASKIGGPSVHPPQPEGVYAFTQRKKSWRTSQGQDRYRRGLYTFFYRSAPYPMLTTFDAPKFNQTCTRRPRSNTPLQSLTMANDQAMQELTRRLARDLLAADFEDERSRLQHAFRTCFARAPSTGEMQYLLDFLSESRAQFAARPTDAVAAAGSKKNAESLAAWVATLRVLFNLDEFVTRE